MSKIIFIYLLAISLSLTSQIYYRSTQSDLLSVICQKREERLLITKDGKRVVINLKQWLSSVGEIEEFELLWKSAKENSYYLVFTISAISHPDNPQGNCGAGEETTLIWLKLNKQLIVEAQQSQLIDSCLDDNFIALNAPHLANLKDEATAYYKDESILRIKRAVIENYFNPTTIKPKMIKYDNSNPADGIVVTDIVK